MIKKKPSYEEGDMVICIKETSGQGGTVNVGEKGTAVHIYSDMICPYCLDFKRADGTFAHVDPDSFEKWPLSEETNPTGDMLYDVINGLV